MTTSAAVGKAARQAVLSGPCGRSGAASAAGSPGHRRRDRQVGWLREFDPEKAVNQALGALFEEDQADRRGEFPADLDERDERRRRRVEQLLAEGTVVDPDDLFCAAMVFQHGADRTHFLRAHELAKRAAELGSTRLARWLAAAAYDRWLMTGGCRRSTGRSTGSPMAAGSCTRSTQRLRTRSEPAGMSRHWPRRCGALPR
jgi:hypothetical protein